MNDSKVELKDGFTWREKLLMRAGAAGMIGIGAVGSYLHDPRVALGYVLFVAIAGAGVMYDFLCVYCPYPFRYSDCLFFPYPLVAAVKTRRTTAIPQSRKVLAAIAFGGIVILPQYALWGQWILFAVFWGLAAILGVTIPLRFCRRCRHGHCPVNLVPGGSESGEDAS